MRLAARWAVPRARQLVGPAVSAVSLAAVLWWALHQPAPQWPTGRAGVWLLVLAVCVYAGVTILRGVRWHLILGRAGIEASMADAQALVVVGYMGNTVLPARGGELLRMFLLGQRTGSSRVTILGTIVAERVLDVLALLVLLLLLTIVNPSGTPSALHTGSTAVIAIGGLCALAVAVLIVWWSVKADNRFRVLVERLSSLTLATRNLLSVQGLLLILLTGAVWAGEGVLYWLVGGALHLHINIFQGCFLVVLSSLVAIIPAAPGYAGTYDAAIQFGLKTLHAQGGRAISFGLLVRLVIFVPTTVAGLILLVVRYGGLSSLRRLHHAARFEGPRDTAPVLAPTSIAGGVPSLRSTTPMLDSSLELVSK